MESIAISKKRLLIKKPRKQGSTYKDIPDIVECSSGLGWVIRVDNQLKFLSKSRTIGSKRITTARQDPKSISTQI